MNADYFPLVKGAIREYATKYASGTGSYKIEVLAVSTKGDTTTAKCRRTVRWMNEHPQVSVFTIKKNAKGVRVGQEIAFNYPVQIGTEWIRSPRRFWIEALDAWVKTPAGRFEDCMRVAYLIAEGDGGSGERHYAPGIGLVKIADNDEANPFTHELIAHSG